MEFPERLSGKLTKTISEVIPEFPEEKLELIDYGLASIITATYKAILIFIVSWMLGMLIPSIIAYLSFGLVRTFAFGVHAKTEISCLISSSAIFFGIIFIGSSIHPFISTISIIYSILLLLFYKYSPADTEEKPIVSASLRKRFKYLSILTLIVSYFLALIYNQSYIGGIITMSALAEGFLISPLAYRLFGKPYGIGINYKS